MRSVTSSSRDGWPFGLVEAGLARAKLEGYAAVAIALDTPGGHLEATRDIGTELLGGADPARVFRLIADEALALTGAHAVVVGSSNFSQKKSQGTWGTVIRGPYAIAQMLGV